MITASELEILRKKANEGQQAFAELKKAKVTASVKALVFSESNKAGKFLPKSEASLQAFIESLSAEQATKFSALVGEIPKSEKFGEIGSGAQASATVQAEVEAKVAEKIKANDKLSYSEALKQVMAENEGLEQRYDEELPSAKRAQRV